MLFKSPSESLVTGEEEFQTFRRRRQQSIDHDSSIISNTNGTTPTSNNNTSNNNSITGSPTRSSPPRSTPPKKTTRVSTKRSSMRLTQQQQQQLLLMESTKRKRKNTLIIPKNNSDAQYMTVMWTHLLKKQFMSNNNPLDLFTELMNDPFHHTPSSSPSSPSTAAASMMMNGSKLHREYDPCDYSPYYEQFYQQQVTDFLSSSPSSLGTSAEQAMLHNSESPELIQTYLQQQQEQQQQQQQQQPISKIPTRYLSAIRASTDNEDSPDQMVSLKLYGVYNADHMLVCENECRFLHLLNHQNSPTVRTGANFTTVASSSPPTTKMSQQALLDKNFFITHYASHYIGNSIWIEMEPHFGSLYSIMNDRRRREQKAKMDQRRANNDDTTITTATMNKTHTNRNNNHTHHNEEADDDDDDAQSSTSTGVDSDEDEVEEEEESICLSKMLREDYQDSHNHTNQTTTHHGGINESTDAELDNDGAGAINDASLRRDCSLIDEVYLAALCKQILLTLCSLHSKGIVHRDLRPRNFWITNGVQNQGVNGEEDVILSSSVEEEAEEEARENNNNNNNKENNKKQHVDRQYTLKLASFTSCYQFQCTDNDGKIRDVSSLMITDTDCLYWLAPEIIASEDEVVEYDAKADIWSFGMVVWSMLNGCVPPLAHLHNPEDIVSCIVDSDFQPRLSDFEHYHDYSLLFDDFLTKCLCRDVNKRWTSEQLLNHEFITKRIPKNTSVQALITEFFNSQ